MSYLISSAISLLDRSAKLSIGLALRLCLAMSESFVSTSGGLCSNFSEIASSLLSTSVSLLSTETSEVSEKNRTAVQENTHAIATKHKKKRNRFDIKLFAGFLSLLNSCSIWAKWFIPLASVDISKKCDTNWNRTQQCLFLEWAAPVEECLLFCLGVTITILPLSDFILFIHVRAKYTCQSDRTLLKTFCGFYNWING